MIVKRSSEYKNSLYNILLLFNLQLKYFECINKCIIFVQRMEND